MTDMAIEDAVAQTMVASRARALNAFRFGDATFYW
ncbi:MAG: phosphate ABC transporter permease PstC, partial [Methylobacteriaceae bacterium]|nr:phosphate ABC transporter permease PstC [Methylobacteriaceae bacterium]